MEHKDLAFLFNFFAGFKKDNRYKDCAAVAVAATGLGLVGQRLLASAGGNVELVCTIVDRLIGLLCVPVTAVCRVGLLEAEVPDNVEKPDLAVSSMEELEAYIRAKYELGSFKQGGDGFVPHVRIKSESCVGMIEFVGVLFIRLEEAHDLPGSHDAYCEFQLGDRSCRSKTVKGSASACKWGESLSLNTRSTNETLIIKVYDSSKLGGASFLGQAVVALASLTHDGQPNPVELGLQTSGGSRSGSRLSRRQTITRTPVLSLEITYNALDR